MQLRRYNGVRAGVCDSPIRRILCDQLSGCDIDPLLHGGTVLHVPRMFPVILETPLMKLQIILRELTNDGYYFVNKLLCEYEHLIVLRFIIHEIPLLVPLWLKFHHDAFLSLRELEWVQSFTAVSWTQHWRVV